VKQWGLRTAVAWSDTSLNQRFALSYTGYDWNLTANVIWGIHLDSVTDRPQLSPCPVSLTFPFNGCNPDFINVDLTAGKKFGKWQVAWVGFYSSDLTEPVPGYAKQSQFAMGGLLGYDFGPLVLQGYLTTDVWERNYGGHDIRGGRVSSFHFRAYSVLRRPPRPLLGSNSGDMRTHRAWRVVGRCAAPGRTGNRSGLDRNNPDGVCAVATQSVRRPASSIRTGVDVAQTMRHECATLYRAVDQRASQMACGAVAVRIRRQRGKDLMHSKLRERPLIPSHRRGPKAEPRLLP
jgi:Putative MetA-pathway of phenol degradation